MKRIIGHGIDSEHNQILAVAWGHCPQDEEFEIDSDEFDKPIKATMSRPVVMTMAEITLPQAEYTWKKITAWELEVGWSRYWWARRVKMQLVDTTKAAEIWPEFEQEIENIYLAITLQT